MKKCQQKKKPRRKKQKIFQQEMLEKHENILPQESSRISLNESLLSSQPKNPKRERTKKMTLPRRKFSHREKLLNLSIQHVNREHGSGGEREYRFCRLTQKLENSEQCFGTNNNNKRQLWRSLERGKKVKVGTKRRGVSIN